MMLISHCGTLFADILKADKGENSIKKIQKMYSMMMCSENGIEFEKNGMIYSVVRQTKHTRDRSDIIKDKIIFKQGMGNNSKPPNDVIN